MTPTDLHAEVLDALGAEICGGVLAPGDVLTLEQLEQRFRVSRTVAREAVRVLASQGLVAARRRVGTTVQGPSAWNVYDPQVIAWRLRGPGRDAQLRSLTALRVAVEPHAARAAAREATADQRSELVGLATRMRELGEAGDLDTFQEVDAAFHAVVLESSGNDMFAALTDVVGAVLRGRTWLGLMPSRPVAEALDLHERVAAAIAAGDGEGAAAAMTALLVEVRGAVAPEPLGGARP